MKRSVVCVMLCGLLCDESILAGQARALSTVADVTVQQVTATSMSEAVTEVFAAQKGSFAVVGFSLGAIVAMACAVHDPGRISHLGLIAANPHGPQPAQLSLWRRWSALTEGGRFEQAVDEVTHTMLRPGTDDVLAHRVRNMADAVGHVSFGRQLRLQATREDMIGVLPKISAPTLVMGGTADPLIPVTYGEKIAALIDTAELRLESGSGHLLPWECSSQVSSGLAGLLMDSRST